MTAIQSPEEQRALHKEAPWRPVRRGWLLLSLLKNRGPFTRKLHGDLWGEDDCNSVSWRTEGPSQGSPMETCEERMTATQSPEEQRALHKEAPWRPVRRGWLQLSLLKNRGPFTRKALWRLERRGWLWLSPLKEGRPFTRKAPWRPGRTYIIQAHSERKVRFFSYCK